MVIYIIYIFRIVVAIFIAYQGHMSQLIKALYGSSELTETMAITLYEERVRKCERKRLGMMELKYFRIKTLM